MAKDGDLEAKLLAADGEPSSPPGTKTSASAAGNTYSLVCALLASLASIIYGYNRGVMSGAQRYVQADLGVSDAQLELLIGLTSVYSLVGSLAAGWACDRAGRHRTVALAAAMFLVGSALTASDNGYAALMVGQLVAGVACGFGLVVAPVYIAEIAPAASRGFLSSITEIAGNLGILISYIADIALAGLPSTLNWRLMIGIGAIPPLFLAASALLVMPETPRWLVLHGHPDEARGVLARTAGDAAIADRRLQEIVASVKEASSKQQARPNGTSTSVWCEILVRPTPRDAGHPGPPVLPAGLRRGGDGPVRAARVRPRRCHLRVRRARCHCPPWRRQDGVHRHPALPRRPPGPPAHAARERGWHGGIAPVLGFSMRSSVAASATSWWAAATCVAAAAGFMATFSLGFGPVISMYGSEILPLRLRAQGIGIGTALNRVMSAVVGMTFISMYEAVGMAGSFYIFAAFSAAAWVFVYACLPQTKEKSLEEMEALFDGSARRKQQAPL